MSSKYIRFQQGVNTTGNLITYDKNFILEQTSKHSDSDWYKSLFYFGEDANEYFKEKNSIAGFNGEAKTNILVFDFDSKKDIDLARADAVSLLERLQNYVNVGQSASAFFSGNKGFHLELTVDEEYTDIECKDICSTLCYDLETFDNVIYNTTRLYRIVNTRHNKSGLYKIELELNDLVNLPKEDILELAKTPQKLLPNAQACESIKLKELYDSLIDDEKKFQIKKAKKLAEEIKNSSEEIDGIRGLDKIDFSKMPKDIPRCIYALEHGIMVPGRGERSEIFRALAVYYRNQGKPKRQTHNILKSIAALNVELYPEHEPFDKVEIWNTVVTSAYNGTYKQIPGASGISPENPIIARYCQLVGEFTSKKCLIHSKVEQVKTTVQIDEVSDSFSRFATDFDKNTIKTGIKLIDNYMNIAVGTVSLIAGAPGSGKTSCALQILENSSKLGQSCMFFSMDMHKNMVYLKLAAKLTNYTQAEIMNFYKNRDTEKINEVRAAISSNYNNVFFDFSSTLSMEEMRDKVLETQEQNNKEIKLVIVDYATRLSGPYSDAHANATHNALKSTEIATVTDAAWLYIAQVSRQSGNGATPLRSKRVAAQSGEWENASSNVITVWRPFMGIEDQDDVMRMFLAKNRAGREVERPLWWNGARGTVTDMTPEELETYKMEREPAESELLKKRFTGQN